MSSLLDDILARLNEAPPEDAAAIRDEVLKQTNEFAWVPNPGPQTEAYFSEADELFYGGEAGGGKTDLVVGTALTAHQNSLILRRLNTDARALGERMLEIVGNTDGWNGQLLHYRKKPLAIDFAGCQHEKDKQNFKGKPHDLIAFDEITDFLESQFRFIKGWNRSANKNQRCRVICTGNPPTTADGLWVIQYWGPWLDDTHPNPAKEGELRWYTTIDNKDTEVDGPGPHLVNGEEIYARSRTFIRARLADNPDLAETDYASVLAAMPEELRAAYKDGRFDKSMKDNPFQCIPTAWIKAAQERWTPKPPAGIPMCALGVDVAQGGADNNVIYFRHDAWFSEAIVIEGKKTPVGTDTAGVIVALRRDNAIVTIDCGGGYGGSAFKHMVDNGIEAYAYKGGESSEGVTQPDRKLGFANRRTEAYWRFREALDPGQRGGSMIALPPDQRLLSDLAAPRFQVKGSTIHLETKDALKERLGRSPDHGDAIVMCWLKGPRMSSDYGQWVGRMPGSRSRTPKVNLGHPSVRRRR